MSTNNCASDNKDEAINNDFLDMNYQIFKIKFTGKEESDALKWEDLERVVFDKIKYGRNHSVKVLLSNPMPSEELNDVVRELCNKIEFERDYRTNVSREDECYGEREHQGVFISGLVSAIYYLEIRKTDYW